jgi:iron complex transport system ATP-binding protein
VSVLRIEAAGHGAILQPTTLTVDPGALTVLLGPNGAGKTTLLRVLLGLLPATTGTAALAQASPQERARQVAYLPQARPLAWPLAVRDVIALGRFAHGGTLGRLSPPDVAAVERALKACDLDHLAHRAADTLAGGALARVHLARARAAEAPMIVADAPVASLDPRAQHRVLGLLRDHVAGGGGALVVLHDLDLAARYADRLLWMSEGSVVADGSVAATMTPDRIRTTYGVTARVEGGRVLIDGPV